MRSLFLAAPILLLLAGCPAETTPPPPPLPATLTRPTVVTASPALAEILCAIGAREHLVGVSRYCAHPPELADLPRIGGVLDANLEAIDSLSPELVLLQNKDANVLALAERRGFRVLTFRIETIEDTFSALTEVGALFGKSAEAKREVTRLRTALDAARARRPATPPRVLLVFNHRPGELGLVSSPGSGTFISQCLEVAGGINCLDDLPPSGWHQVAKEVLLERAPDVIIELTPDPPSDAQAAALREDWQVLSEIPAVAQDRVVIVSGSEVLIPGPRLDQVVEKLSRALRGENDVR